MLLPIATEVASSAGLKVVTAGGVVSGVVPSVAPYRANVSQLTGMATPSRLSKLALRTASLKAAVGAVAKPTVTEPIRVPAAGKVPPAVVLEEKPEMPPSDDASDVKPVSVAAV